MHSQLLGPNMGRGALVTYMRMRLGTGKEKRF